MVTTKPSRPCGTPTAEAMNGLHHILNTKLWDCSGVRRAESQECRASRGEPGQPVDAWPAAWRHIPCQEDIGQCVAIDL